MLHDTVHFKFNLNTVSKALNVAWLYWSIGRHCVGFLHLRFRRSNGMNEVTVRSEDQQPCGRFVQPPHGEHAVKRRIVQIVFQDLEHRTFSKSAFLFVEARTNHACWFVEDKGVVEAGQMEQLSVPLNGLCVGIELKGNVLDNGTSDSDLTSPNGVLCLPFGRKSTGSREVLMQSNFHRPR